MVRHISFLFLESLLPTSSVLHHLFRLLSESAAQSASWVSHHHPGDSLLLFLDLASLLPGYAVPFLHILPHFAIAPAVTMKRKRLRTCVSENVPSLPSHLRVLLCMEF